MPIPFSSKGDEILEFFDVVPNDPALRVSFSGQAVEFTNEVGEHSTRGEPSGTWRHGRGRFASTYTERTVLLKVVSAH